MLINFVSAFPRSSICVKIFFSEDVRCRFHINRALSQDVSCDFLSLFVCCTNMKCENILTDIPSYYSYVHVQYLLCAISIFLFSYQWTRCIPADLHVSRIT